VVIGSLKAYLRYRFKLGYKRVLWGQKKAYRLFFKEWKCPGCEQPFTPVRSHHPEAPGSTAGCHCFNCNRDWTDDWFPSGVVYEIIY
jgi:hypothetical protein